MTKWKHAPHSHKRPPHFELGRNRDHDFGRDDNDDDDDDDDKVGMLLQFKQSRILH